MKSIATLFSIFLLASCTNNYSDTNTNDDAINKTDIKNDNTVITNIENGSRLENNSNPLIFNKINSLITYDDSQDKVDITHDNTAISINLFGGDQSDITLMMDGRVVRKGLDVPFNYTYGLFNYTYGEDLQSALKRISVFANDADRQILILPTTTEEYLSYNAILFDDSGFLHTYTFEVAEWNCGDIESITVNTKADANAIQVMDDTGKNCSTRTYLIDGEYIKAKPKSLSFTDIEAKYDENTHKIFTFDTNADGIDGKPELSNKTDIYVEEKSSGSLCIAGEIPVVSCKINEPQTRIVSICGSTDSQNAVYRFGKKNKVELSKHFTSREPLKRTLVYSAYTTYFHFKNDGYRYIIGVPEEAYGVKAFIDIVSPNGSTNTKECTTNSFAEKKLVSPAIIDLEESKADLP